MGPGIDDVTRGYGKDPGSYDELLDDQGNVRAHWAPFMAHLAGMGLPELGRRWAKAQELIHENGVSYNVHGDPQGMQRLWPLSPVPLMVSPEEWQIVVAALTQRARLLELILEDIYGPQRLLAEGLLPPELLFAHPDFLHPCHGQPVPGGRWLPLYAVDLVRGPGGDFQVLSDRTHVPTGAGYALENRIIVSRALTEAFRACNVERLASFFRTMRDTLAAVAPRNKDNPRVVMLSAGPADPTYFEQAYLAQYLGYPLVHGGDLTVRGGRVLLKTLGGLHPVDVILRRVGDDLCDPLELRPDALVGVPGLLQAVREKNVAVANPIGSGIAAAPALLPYLPKICRHLLGEDLRFSSVETLWCGDAASRARALERLPHMVIKPAFATATTPSMFGALLDGEAREALRARIEANPAAYIAQEQIALATIPALAGGNLEPRHWVLRTYLVAAGQGHTVMPGGLTCFAPGTGVIEVSIQRGGGSKDTWVQSGGPVATFSLLPSPTAAVALSRGGNDLPSRVADNLFWLGRYAERAESLARLGRVIVARLGDQDPEAPAAELAALIRALATQTEQKDLVVPDCAPGVIPAWEALVLAALHDAAQMGSLQATVRAVHRVARECRDRISGDTWRVLMGLAAELRAPDPRDGGRLSVVLRTMNHVVVTLSAFSGLVGDSMNRGQAWRFLDMGRRLERAAGTVTLLLALGDKGDREGPLLEAVMEVADSGMTYRRRYLNRLEPAPVLDLLLTDETNPRSVIFQIITLADHIAELPRDTKAAVHNPQQRLALHIRSQLQLADAESLSATGGDGARVALTELLTGLSEQLPALSDSLSASYLYHAAVSRQLGGVSFDRRA